MAPVDAEDLPPGWRVWNHETGGRIVLAFRPDVFNAESFPPACLPTIVVAPGRSPDEPPGRRVRSDAWYVAAYLEPDVRLRELANTFDSRDAAIAGAIDAASRFTAGDVDVEAAYQVPRESYLAQLSALLPAHDDRQ